MARRHAVLGTGLLALTLLTVLPTAQVHADAQWQPVPAERLLRLPSAIALASA